MTLAQVFKICNCRVTCMREANPDDGVWAALADPTRRRILDLLRERPLTTGGVAAHFPISRIAVMRHLRVLAAAGLVANRARGRERWHYLNLVSLQTIHERWSRPVASGWATSLLRQSPFSSDTVRWSRSWGSTQTQSGPSQNWLGPGP